MTKFYFVRHGQTNENKNKRIQGRRDIPLNEDGVSQAHQVGKYLKGLNISFDYIYSSPLSRAYDTACAIKEELGSNIDIIKEDDYTERSFGVKEGCSIAPEVFADILDDSAEGLEKSYEIQARVLGKTKELALKHKDKNIIVVAHSHTIKALTTAVDGEKYKFNDRLVNCALSIFECDGSNCNVLDFNIDTQ